MTTAATGLIKFNEAYQALMIAKSVDEVKGIIDQATALKAIYKQAGDCLEMQNACAEIIIRGAVRGAEIADGMQANGQLNGQGGDRKSTLHHVRLKFDDVGIGYIELHRWRKIKAIPEDARENFIAETKAQGKELTKAGVLKLGKELIHKAERTRQLEAIKTAQWPTGQYHVIAVDPPWAYAIRPDDSTHRAANPYPSMSVEEITNLKVPGLALGDCVLWLWTTNAFMEEAHQIARAWGFEKKTILTWVKDRMGTGDWLRGQTEHCLMCVKGKPVINLTNQTTVIHGPLREHSRKPEQFYQLVNELCPGQKVELFARQEREGWNTYGNELDTF